MITSLFDMLTCPFRLEALNMTQGIIPNIIISEDNSKMIMLVCADIIFRFNEYKYIDETYFLQFFNQKDKKNNLDW